MRQAFGCRLLWLVPLIFGCAARSADSEPQWLVAVETDAPVPELGDRLLVEVLASGQTCDGCSRHLAVGDPKQWPLSFGVAAAADVTVQLTLFRAALIRESGLPEGDALLQARARLPALGGVTSVSIRLEMGCFGLRADGDAGKTCDPTTRTLVADPLAGESNPRLAVGSWGPAQSRPCLGVGKEHMICVPGGAFLLGDADVSLISAPAELPIPEHLVQLSPFYLDESELRVGDARSLLAADPSLARPGQAEFCNFLGTARADNDALPLNCVSRAEAQALCAAQGKTLPTEAEWEYAAGNLASETPFPWGHDADICAHAVVARNTLIAECRVTPTGTLPAGPQAVGTSADVSLLGIRDLGGNLSEWLADGFDAYGGPCWQSGDAALVDPVCATDTGLGAIRGGNWQLRPASAKVVQRGLADAETRSPALGFRCAFRP